MYTVYSTAMAGTPDRRSLGNNVVQMDPLDINDSTELFGAFDDERVWAGGWGGGPAARPDKPEGMRAVVDKLITAGVCYAVRDAVTNERCMFGGAAYAPSVWGTPVNAATNLALLGHAFQDCEFGRVMLQTDVLNTRMQGAIEKMGASREGVLRRHKRRADGTFRDSVVFSILADEWPAIRDRLTSRLPEPAPRALPPRHDADATRKAWDTGTVQSRTGAVGGNVRVRISWPADELIAELADTPTTAALTAALPVEGSANTWGEEVYFSLPPSVESEANARQVVDPGTVCFWVDGCALALPYGPTPVSRGDECRLVTACNVLGAVEGDPRRLQSINAGDQVRVEQAD